LTLYDVVDITGSITPGGSSVPVTTTIPAQNVRLTFSGTTGQRVSLETTNVTLGTGTITSILIRTLRSSEVLQGLLPTSTSRSCRSMEPIRSY
jgi:hypothetical protein